MLTVSTNVAPDLQLTGPWSWDWSSLRGKCNCLSRDFTLEIAVRLSLLVPGNIVEFGVYQGHSTRAIQRSLKDWAGVFPRGRVPRKTIFACDSFQGLPEKYEQLPPGSFACAVPHLPGVKIVQGYFQDSLTPELALEVGAVSLAHLDADLYSSTACALAWLTPLLHTGSLLLFDEFLGEHESEKRALEDWVRQTGVRCIPVAEFLRPPSGHGERTDKRSLYQIIGPGTGLPEGADWRPGQRSFRDRCRGACRAAGRLLSSWLGRR
jgi:hypothetical protein